MKKGKGAHNWHTSDSQVGSGDYHGPAIKQPIGTIKRSYMDARPKGMSGHGKPPKALA